MSLSRANTLLHQIAPPHIDNSDFTYFNDLIVEVVGKVGIITLNRPKYLNALCDRLVSELRAALVILDQHADIAAIVITGGTKFFAAGADISQMATQNYNDVRKFSHFAEALGSITNDIAKPIIAAVCGFALGGGSEIAMMCDVIIAGESAKFGLPEVKIGTIPGAGGTQRLIRAVGKSKAMEMVLTGTMISATEALNFGLVSRVVPDDKALETAIQIAEQISQISKPISN